MSSIGGIDPSVLLGFYQTQLATTPSAIAAANAQNAAASQTNSATANDSPPWYTPPSSGPAEKAAVLSTTNYINTSNVPLSAGATGDTKMEQDNQKLFSLYNAVNTLSQLAVMAQSSTATSGQLAGLNDRFQTGLEQIQKYLSTTSFNNFNLEAATPSNKVTATANIGISNPTYSTKQLVTNANINNAVSGLSSSDSFTIAIKKDGTTTNVAIDLSQVQGTLTLSNIVSYINNALAADGFQTRFQKTEKGGTATSDTNATYGLEISPGGAEQVSLAAPSNPALYIAGNSGVATETNTTINSATSQVNTTPADQTGRLTKLSLNGGTPTATFSVNQQAATGTSTAQATAVDSSGNVYVIGNATGNLGTSQINQGSQDAYLTKYDSAGNVVWQTLLGSAGSANGYGLAVDPATGGVVVTGSSTADLSTTSVANGNNDSFVASYASDGSQTWIKQVETLATNQSNAVSVDASGNIYVGGSVSGGVVGAGQTAQGGGDAYLAKFSSSGKLIAESQFGTSGADSVAATATGSDGSLYVASVQNGEAIVTKYAGGDITLAPSWTEDLGPLQAGGNIGGLAVSGSQVYVSGTTSNGNLTAGGSATVTASASGGLNAFVFGLTDNGATASAGNVTYVGTGGSDTGADVTVGSDGTVYLTGSTTGTFAGQSRNIQNVTNAFAAAIATNGTVSWTKQFGGADGVSTGAGIAISPSGSSVLDALGLPQGAISPRQSVDLTQQTTLRAADSFQIEIEGVAPRTSTITIAQGETYNSLVTKINAQLGQTGIAAVNYSGAAENMTITAHPGSTINLIAGPKDFDALARLGIPTGVISAPSKNGTGSSSTNTTNSSVTSGSSTSVKPTFGLGLTGTVLGPLDISTKTGADLTRSQLLTVLSNIQNTFQTSNAPPPSTTGPVGNTTGTVSSNTTAQLASYNVALSLLGTSSSDAVNNIAAIVSGGTAGSPSLNPSIAPSSILGMFN
ncbi:MAG TPA: hypothetical protein VMO78_10890 [Rhizomicrobium sp.]|nr:hypothetical protein [Rhizomicrobium sp.]